MLQIRTQVQKRTGTTNKSLTIFRVKEIEQALLPAGNGVAA